MQSDLHVIKTIFKKELVDTLRDRRTLATMLLVPMVVYPMIVLLGSEIVAMEQQTERNRRVRVRVWQSLPSRVQATLHDAEALDLSELVTTATSAPAAARLAFAAGQTDVVIAASATAALTLESLGTARIQIFFDDTQPFSYGSAERVRDVLGKLALEIRKERLEGLDLPRETATPLALSMRSVSTSSEVGSQLASRYLPLLILFFIALSSFYPAVDLTAGEKERGTLATLLTAPIRPSEIVWGKYLAVVTVGTLAGLLNVGVMTLTLLRAIASAPGGAGAALPAVTPGSVLGLVVGATLLASVVGALMLVAATFARSFRDASNLLAPVMLAALMPAFLTMLPSAELTAAWAAVPIANGVLFMKSSLTGSLNAGHVAIVCVSSLAYAALLLAGAARVFSDERALFSSSGRRADFSQLFFAPPAPGPAVAIGFTAVLFIGNYYGGLLIEAMNPAVGVAILQLFLQLGGTVLLAWWLRQQIAPGHLLQTAPPARSESYGAGTLVGAGAWLGVSLPLLWLQSSLLPGQAAASDKLGAALGIDQISLPILIICLAIIPAIAEELAFRGAVLTMLRRRMSTGGAIALSSLLFGLVHGSAFRLLPTAALGVVLAVLAIRTRSIWPGVIAHALTNATAIALQRLAPESVLEALGRPTAWALVGLAALGGGLLWAKTPSSPAPKTTTDR